MNDIYQRLEKLIAALQASGRVRIPSSEFRYFSEAVDPSVLATLKEKGFHVDIDELYRQVEFIDLRWTSADDTGWTFHDEDTDMVLGGLCVPPFSAFAASVVTPSGPSTIDPDSTFDEAERAALIDYFPFDDLRGNGAVCFRRVGGEVEDALFLVSTGMRSRITPLGVGWRKYLEAGFASFFLEGWQEAAFLAKGEDVVSFYRRQLPS